MCLLLLAYAIAPIVAGHGILPMGFLLISFQSSTWGLVLGWIAVLATIAGFITLRAGSPAQLLAQLFGTLVLYATWVCNILHFKQFNAQAEQGMALESMLLLSLPFQVATAVVVCILAIQLKRARSKLHDASAP